MIDTVRFEDALKKAQDENWSDMHIAGGEPAWGRVDGELFSLRNDFTDEFVDSFFDDMLAANPAAAETFAQKKKATVAFVTRDGVRTRCRLWTAGGRRNIALRFFMRELPKLEEEEGTEVLQQLALLAEGGIVFIVGRNGSGKSTLMYRMVDFRNRKLADHILTFESSIEYEIAAARGRVRQCVEGVDFNDLSDAVEGSLVENPDCVVNAEARTARSMAATITLGYTGIPTFTSTHTTDTTRAVARIVDEMPADTANQVRTHLLSSTVAIVGVRLPKMLTGKRGMRRMPVYEILPVTDDVRQYLADDSRSENVVDFLETGIAGAQSFEMHLDTARRMQKINEQTAMASALRPERLRRLMARVTA